MKDAAKTKVKANAEKASIAAAKAAGGNKPAQAVNATGAAPPAADKAADQKIVEEAKKSMEQAKQKAEEAAKESEKKAEAAKEKAQKDSEQAATDAKTKAEETKTNANKAVQPVQAPTVQMAPVQQP